MYTFTLEASGTGQSSWTASGLPDGLTLEGMTITGTPAVYGEFEVIITVTNETGTDTRTFTLKIYDVSESLNRNAPEITSGAPADGYYKRFYSHTFTARGQTPITWHLSGNVPEGLEIDSGTGRFSGSPKQTGEFAFTVSAANKSGTRSETVKLRVLDVPASMLMYERVCSDPLVLRLSEQKGSGLKTAKIFRDNYRAFRSHRSKDSGVTFVEFIAGTLMDYTASAQFSNMTSLISAVFRGFDKGADFYIEYPDNAHVSQSAMLSDSDSESESESESQAHEVTRVPIQMTQIKAGDDAALTFEDYLREGNEAFNLGIYNSALKNFFRALELDDNDSRPYIGLAGAYRAKGLYFDAKRILDEAMIIFRKNPTIETALKILEGDSKHGTCSKCNRSK